MGALDIDRLEDKERLKRIEEKLDSLLDLIKQSQPVKQKYCCPTCKDKGIVNQPIFRHIEDSECPNKIPDYIEVIEIPCPTCTRNQSQNQESFKFVQHAEEGGMKNEKNAQRAEAEGSWREEMIEKADKRLKELYEGK